STIAGNTTGPHGGGIEAFDGTLVLTDSTVSSNAVTGTTDFRSGGGIWAGLADVSITNSTIRNNRSTEFGGGIGYSGGLGMTSSAVSANRAHDVGGGINAFVDPSGGAARISVWSTIVGARGGRVNDGNRASWGGGIAANGANGSVTVLLGSDAAVIANVAAYD